MGGLAGAVVRLGAFLDDKINPIIKPVMESVKTEGILELQEHSARVVPTLLKVCLRRGLSNVVEKVVKNLICFTSANHMQTPRIQNQVCPSILFLKFTSFY